MNARYREPSQAAGTSPQHIRALALDGALATAIVRRRRPSWIATARVVSAAVEPVSVYPALAVLSCARTRRASVWRPLLTVASGMAVRRLLADAVARPRPPEAAWLTVPEGYSWPSRHTTMAVLAAGGVCRAMDQGAVTEASVCAAAGVAVGLSRLCLGVHWPTDVVGGWLLAKLWLSLTDLLMERKKR